MQESLISQGLDLMLFGMGTVCVFLAVLVVVTALMSKILVRFFPEPIEGRALAKRPITPSSTAVDSRTLTIIQAAIQQHRQK